MADNLQVPTKAREADRAKKRITDLERKLLDAQADHVPFSMWFTLAAESING